MATYDLYIEPAPIVDQKYGLGLMGMGYTRSVGVRGPYKMVVQWAKRFLTPVGSDPADLTAGTEFPNLIGANISDIEDIRDVVLLAIQECDEQMRSAQSQQPQLDDDEVLQSSVLTSFEAVGADGFTAWVDIHNILGTAITVRLPQHSIRTVP